jgi:hypothetical protein
MGIYVSVARYSLRVEKEELSTSKSKFGTKKVIILSLLSAKGHS